MRVDIAVKERFNISRQKASELIKDGKVSVNGKAVLKPSEQVTYDDVITLESSDILKYVGRGGLKLEKALDCFDIDPNGLVCIDIGASMGGFTDCLLQKNAHLVYAVDVGSSQLADKLKNNKRVISMENTDIRTAQLPKADIVCVDVSFISVTKILYKAKELLNDNGKAVILIKPQFEAGRHSVGKNGIVKDKRIHKKLLSEVMDNVRQSGMAVKGFTHSPIKGGDGNIEYFICLVNGSDGVSVDINAAVDTAFDSFNG